LPLRPALWMPVCDLRQGRRQSAHQEADMNGSRKILVVKRGAWTEPFQLEKLRLCLWRALGGDGESFQSAQCLAQAVGIYLKREKRWRISSKALLEIAVRALTQTGYTDAAKRLEDCHQQRLVARRGLQITQAKGPGENSANDCWVFRWDRNYVTRQIEQRWEVGHAAAAVISADIEDELLDGRPRIDRHELMDIIDERVDSFGLAPWCLLASMQTKGLRPEA
jgi:hypothetical protein